MKIKSLEVMSYRSCIKTRLPLNRELTALIGVNSAGKSNILNALLLLKKACRSRFILRPNQDSPYNSCNIKVEIEDGGKTIYIAGEVIFETDERNFDDVMSTNLRWNFREYTGKSKWIHLPIEYLAFSEQSHSQVRINLRGRFQPISRQHSSLPKELDLLAMDIVRFFGGINYYSASQFSDPSRCPVSIELEENRPLKKMRPLVGHEQFILDLYNSWKTQDKQFKRYMSTVGQDGIALVDDTSFIEVEMPSSSYEVQSAGKIKKIERNRLLIIPIFTVAGSKLSPNQLSEGTFKTLALLFYVLTDDSKLLLIEEPEVCIHHGLLSSIISLIKSQSRQKQIVISTHSDFVLDHLKPENLVLVKRQPEKGTIATPLNKSMSRNDYKTLREYLEESGNLGDYWREGGFESE